MKPRNETHGGARGEYGTLKDPCREKKKNEEQNNPVGGEKARRPQKMGNWVKKVEAVLRSGKKTGLGGNL